MAANPSESGETRPDEAEDVFAELLVALHMEDLEALKSLSKGKGREGEPSDAELALEVYGKELRSQQTLLEDRRMCRSIRTAINLDGPLISSARHEEAQAIRDRRFALSGKSKPKSRLVKGNTLDDKELEDIAARFAFLNASADDSLPVDDHDDCGEASSSTSRWTDTVVGDHCVACLERKPGKTLHRGPCSHAYCDNCIRSLFEASMTDDTLFPPSCCRQLLPISEVGRSLPKDLVTRFEHRSVELSQVDRTYCAVPECSSFIPLRQGGADNATCPKCRAETCTKCKQLGHDGDDCPLDGSLQVLLQTAREAGWQRCSSCRRMIELDHGCNHIRCVCRAEFCYSCGLPWKTCSCEQWNEERLLQRANRVVNRRPVANADVHAEQVRQVREALEQHHECDHRRWKYVPGQHQCEECNNWLPEYIFVCRQCHIMACNRCRRNRL